MTAHAHGHAHAYERVLALALALGLAIACAACSKKAAVIDEPEWVSARSDESGACTDVHLARACYADGAPPARVARTAPTDDGEAWRCVGQRDERRCRRRSGLAGAFVCTDGECVQDYPRLPDDGEWECFERAGAVVCRGGEPAAGVVARPRDPGWICSESADASPSARLCVDLDPDPSPRDFEACQYRDTTRRLRRVCAKKSEARFGDRCDASAACPRGAACVDGACVPSFRPRPACWLDAECGPGRACVLATCIAGAP